MRKYVIKSNSKNFKFLVVVMGDVNVGKTNIIRRLLGEEFREYEATVGVDFSEYIIKDVDKEDKNIQLSVQIWDTCNNEINLILISRSRKIPSSNYKGSYIE